MIARATVPYFWHPSRSNLEPRAAVLTLADRDRPPVDLDHVHDERRPESRPVVGARS